MFNIGHSISTNWCLLLTLPSGPGSGTDPICLHSPQPSDRPVFVDVIVDSASVDAGMTHELACLHSYAPNTP